MQSSPREIPRPEFAPNSERFPIETLCLPPPERVPMIEAPPPMSEPSPTTTPTPTPTPSPLPTYPSELCLTKNQAPNTQYAFGYKGIVNGKPSWTGSTYDVVYNNTNTPPRWEISGYSPNNIILQSNANIPQGLWTELGSSNTWLMTTGTCVTAALNASVSKTMESCLNQSDGTITVTAWAGVPPYSYSLDALTYQSSPTFTGLPSGLGTVYVKDSTGLVIIRGYSILAGPAPTTYNLTLNSSISTITSSSSNNTKSVAWTLTVSPPLPAGVSINTDILITNGFTNNYNSQQQILFNRNYSVTANGNAVINTNGNEVITSQSNTRLCNGNPSPNIGSIYSGISKTYNVTLSGGSITGTNTFGVEIDNQGVSHRIPQLGGVSIGNGVNISSLCNIHAGTIDPTLINDFVQIDSMVHIGHNCNIGKSTLITACTEISGSVILGEKCYIGPNSSLMNKITLGNNVIVGLGAVVTKSFGSNSVIAGNPADHTINLKKNKEILTQIMEEKKSNDEKYFVR